MTLSLEQRIEAHRLNLNEIYGKQPKVATEWAMDLLKIIGEQAAELDRLRENYDTLDTAFKMQSDTLSKETLP